MPEQGAAQHSAAPSAICAFLCVREKRCRRLLRGNGGGGVQQASLGSSGNRLGLLLEAQGEAAGVEDGAAGHANLRKAVLQSSLTARGVLFNRVPEP
jgi:hypothetical protein